MNSAHHGEEQKQLALDFLAALATRDIDAVLARMTDKPSTSTS